MSDFNRKVIEEFRANAGRVGGMFEGSDLLLLTTTGARSGTRRTHPVGYARDGGRILVFASNAGADTHPAWYRNLLVNPDVIVEIGEETFGATAVVLRGAERDRLYAEQGERVPAYAAYQAGTSRIIPVVALLRRDSASTGAGLSADAGALPAAGLASGAVAAGGAGQRGRAIGDELVRIHDGLRAELAAVRSGTGGGADLRTHCLALCGAMREHHTNEDAVFPRIERQFPELSPIVSRLRREHAAVAERIGRLRELLDSTDDVSAELDRLAGEIEAHFAYEERQLVPVLNKLCGPTLGQQREDDDADEDQHDHADGDRRPQYGCRAVRP